MDSRASEAQQLVLCLVTDRAVARRPLEELVALAFRAGADWLQIRERGLAGGALLALADRLVKVARQAAEARVGSVRIVVNRRIDVALACGADGVHLGFDALPVPTARQLLPDGALVGVSAHQPGEVETAAAQGARYAHLAPIFAPRSKAATRAPLGASALGAARAAGIPVLAQGGIDASNAAEVVAAGAAGVAVTGAILAADDPAAATAALRRALDAAPRPGPC